MVRPHLENCSVIWSPHYTKDKVLLERVQHRFTRMFDDLKELPYEDRLCKLGLWSLEERRNRADLIEIYKMIKGLSTVLWSRFFSRSENSVTRGHNWKLVKKQVVSIHISTSSPKDLLVVGITWCRKKWRCHRWIGLRTFWSNGDVVRWTFSWTNKSHSPVRLHELPMYDQARRTGTQE